MNLHGHYTAPFKTRISLELSLLYYKEQTYEVFLMTKIILCLIFITSTVCAYPEVWERVQAYELHHNKIYAEPLKVNVNEADKIMLQKLTGIGPKKAQDIITYRELHGSFKKMEDLRKIKGFTKKFIEKLWENNKELILF